MFVVSVRYSIQYRVKLKNGEVYTLLRLICLINPVSARETTTVISGNVRVSLLGELWKLILYKNTFI